MTKRNTLQLGPKSHGNAGRKKAGGRKAGTPNKRTLDLVAQLRKIGYDPVAELIEAGNLAKQEWLAHAERLEAIDEALQNETFSPKLLTNLSDKPYEYLKIMQGTAAAVMPYLFPKRKAVEITGEDGGDIFKTFGDIALSIHNSKKDT